MELKLKNFGWFFEYETRLETTTRPNGWGKTTILNAYYFVLTGKTLYGFEPFNTNTPDGELCEVILTGAPIAGEVRRTLARSGGTKLYVGGNITTQKDFEEAVSNVWDIQFAALCCDSNALTSDSLTSDGLRKLLTAVDVIDSGESNALRKELADLRKQRKEAETYSVVNVTVPQPKCEKLSDAERLFIELYALNVQRSEKKRLDHTCACAVCSQTLPGEFIESHNKEIDTAIKWLAAGSHDLKPDPDKLAEFERIGEKSAAYEAERAEIQRVEMVVRSAAAARNRLIELDKRIAEIDARMRELDAEMVRMELPNGLDVVTEQTTKTGSVKSVCTLMWDGVPLKSINRAKRIEICVSLLDAARRARNMESAPIVVDNAEAITNLGAFDNVIQLIVGKS